VLLAPRSAGSQFLLQAHLDRAGAPSSLGRSRAAANHFNLSPGFEQRGISCAASACFGRPDVRRIRINSIHIPVRAARTLHNSSLRNLPHFAPRWLAANLAQQFQLRQA